MNVEGLLPTQQPFFVFIRPLCLMNRKGYIKIYQAFYQRISMTTHKGIFILMFYLLFSEHSKAVTIIIAPSGSSYTTIQAGVNAANAGDTVLVKAGLYNEAVSFPRSGSRAGGYITLLGQAGAIVDGTGKGQLGIYINSRNYIRVMGLEIQNFKGAGTPIGISVRGSSGDIEILNNKSTQH